MLNRIREAREIIRLATRNELDLLDKLEYEQLKELLDGRVNNSHMSHT
ncbi:hypothetical protein [Chryseobacterium sp.]|nr:hypothetical protein [Chryseobacterium sp.]